jgi:hypothetical protein
MFALSASRVHARPCRETTALMAEDASLTGQLLPDRDSYHVELNPTPARLVEWPEDWRWSRARVHLAKGRPGSPIWPGRGSMCRTGAPSSPAGCTTRSARRFAPRSGAGGALGPVGLASAGNGDSY